MLKVKTHHTFTKPLEAVVIAAAGPGCFSVRDAEGREYANLLSDQDAEVTVGGALGTHLVFHLDDEGRILDSGSFRVTCETEILDAGGRFKRLLDSLYDTMFEWWSGGASKYLRINGKSYRYYVSWLRDHVHALKGMKYFDAGIKSGIELYADSQREDGMIWDKCKQFPRNDIESYNVVQWRRREFECGDFWREIPEYPTRAWQRIPVENDVEFLFIEGLYYTWKACGDDAWMAGLLDNAMRAVGYATSDPYRWSETFQLLKRGYTIDTWDFQSFDDAKRSGSIMRVLLDKTEFNIFHGDNTGMAAGCRYLAEMLRVVGRGAEADTFDALADELKRRLDEVSWNGEFYIHMIPENPDAERDLGDTATDRQITLSNAYALNRHIDHEQCAAIIRSYRRIREEMPETSPAEWYNCYPIFEDGYRFRWDYMNGGVSTICAGELAHGAFEHGFEAYGADILDRIIGLAEQYDGYLHNTFKGKRPASPPATQFSAVDLTRASEADIRAAEPEGLGLDILPLGRQTLVGVDFDLAGAALCLNAEHPEAVVPLATPARSIYLLHTSDVSAHKNAEDTLIGWMTADYTDGTHATCYIQTTRQLEGAKYPAPPLLYGAPTRTGAYRLGWHGEALDGHDTGLFVYGWPNPHPDKELTRLRFQAAETDQSWWIAAITLSDQPVYFPETPIGHGIPDLWGAGAVVYALIEGLAGIVDAGRAYDRVRLSPRWSAAGVNDVTACAKYPASGGYVRYRYAYHPESGRLSLDVTGNAAATHLDLLLPDGCEVTRVLLNGIEETVAIRALEDSRYLALDLNQVGVHTIDIHIQP
jgi:hypothetical protein